MKPFSLSDAKKIVVTGGAGFLGSRVCDELIRKGARKESLVIPRTATDDLKVFSNAMRVTEGADLVIHMAAKVGGIGFNQKYGGDLFYHNISMGINVIESARIAQVQKIVVLGTICAYPSVVNVPFKEEDLWEGYPEKTNAPYGVAKKALWVMLDSYRKQYGLNGVFLLPVNLYGPKDNFDIEDSHVIPALILKFVDAKKNKLPTVTLWGDGTPTREFLYVDDAARAIVLAAENHNSSEPINLGSSQEISIRNLAEIISKKVKYEGKIVWDTSRPNGQARRKVDVSRAFNAFNFKSQTDFEMGLENTIQWWMNETQKN